MFHLIYVLYVLPYYMYYNIFLSKLKREAFYIYK